MTAQRPLARWRRAAVPAVLIGLTLGVTGIAAFADPSPLPNSWGLTGSAFEVKDGNTTSDGTYVDTGGGSSPRLDWDSLNQNATPDAMTARVDVDRPSGGTDDSFGTGTKEDSPVPAVVAGSIGPVSVPV